MSDGLTVNEVLKIINASDDQNGYLEQRQIDMVANDSFGFGASRGAEVAGNAIGRYVTADEAQEAAQAFSDIAKQSFNGDLNAAAQFLKESIDANPEIGDVDFADAVNSGQAAEYIAQTSSARMAGVAAQAAPESKKPGPIKPDTDKPDAGKPDPDKPQPDVVKPDAVKPDETKPVPDKGAEMMRPATQAAPDGLNHQTPPQTAEVPSTLEGLANRFRDRENVNESGFSEGIVVRQNMPNMSGDFEGAAQMATPESHLDDIRYSQTSKVLESVGMDSGTVLADNKIQDYEFAQTISKAGYQAIENDPNLDIDDLTQENHPEAYDEARAFGEQMNLDLDNHPEITIGLMAVEISGNDAIMHAVMEAQHVNMGATETPPPTAERDHSVTDDQIIMGMGR